MAQPKDLHLKTTGCRDGYKESLLAGGMYNVGYLCKMHPCFILAGTSHAFHASAPKEWNRLPLSLFVAQIHFLPSKSDSKLTISHWLSRIWKSKCIFTWRLTIRASDSHFGVTLHAL